MGICSTPPRFQPARTGGQRGFTLIELGLAIGVGVMLMYASILAYDQARDDAGDAIARHKVADLQQMVEAYYSSNNYFPDLPTLQSLWIVRRTADATASPWGGEVNESSSTDDGIEGGDLAGVGCIAPSPCTPGPIPDQSVNSGVLYYYRITVPGSPPQSGVWTFQDDSLGPKGFGVLGAVFVPASGYMVAANKKNHCFYFVTSGRTPGTAGS